jgi:hypothetical protein
MLALFIVLALAMALVVVCCGGSRAPSQCASLRPTRHQIHATRTASACGSPWAHRATVRGAR